jgi:hypothetical protein
MQISCFRRQAISVHFEYTCAAQNDKGNLSLLGQWLQICDYCELCALLQNISVKMHQKPRQMIWVCFLSRDGGSGRISGQRSVRC